jgi:hypothetical protein
MLRRSSSNSSADQRQRLARTAAAAPLLGTPGWLEEALKYLREGLLESGNLGEQQSSVQRYSAAFVGADALALLTDSPSAAALAAAMKDSGGGGGGDGGDYGVGDGGGGGEDGGWAAHSARKAEAALVLLDNLVSTRKVLRAEASEGGRGAAAAAGVETTGEGSENPAAAAAAAPAAAAVATAAGGSAAGLLFRADTIYRFCAEPVLAKPPPDARRSAAYAWARHVAEERLQRRRQHAAARVLQRFLAALQRAAMKRTVHAALDRAKLEGSNEQLLEELRAAREATEEALAAQRASARQAEEARTRAAAARDLALTRQKRLEAENDKLRAALQKHAAVRSPEVLFKMTLGGLAGGVVEKPFKPKAVEVTAAGLLVVASVAKRTYREEYALEASTLQLLSGGATGALAARYGAALQALGVAAGNHLLFVRVDAVPAAAAAAASGAAQDGAPATPRTRRASLLRRRQPSQKSGTSDVQLAGEAASHFEPLLFAFTNKATHDEWLRVLEQRCGSSARE